MKRMITFWEVRLTILLLFLSITKGFTQNSPACIQNYSWATWSNFKGREATGTIQVNGKPVNVTMSANYEFGSTPTIYGFNNFSGYAGVSVIPNSTVPRTEWTAGAGGETKMCFSEPVTNPLLLISSLGSFFSSGNNGNSAVTLRFSEPYVFAHNATGIKSSSDYSITGEEGYAILLFPGTFTCLTIYSDTPEYYTNITWGLQPPIFPVKITENSKSCGSATLTASGGVSYKWSGGTTPTSATNTFEKSGAYAVIATNADGCTSIALKVVEVPSKIKDTTIVKTICQGETFEGYSSSGTYKNSFKTPIGCDSTRTLILSVVGFPQVNLSPTIDICTGKSVQLAPTVTPNNLPISYKWSTGQSTPSINVSQAGSYSLTISNGSCTKMYNTTVAVSKPPELKPNETACYSPPYMILDAGTLSTGTYSYLWSATSFTNPKLTVFQPGIYQVKVSTIGGGCESSRSITLLDVPQIDLGPDKIACEGESVVLRPNVNTSGNAINYTWSTGATGIETRVTQSGQYILTATEGPCSSRDTITVRTNPLPDVSKEANSCNEEPLVASGADNPDFSYLWDTGETSRSIPAQPDGVYRVKITNQFGCSVSRIITVAGPCNPRFYVPDIFTPNGDRVNDTFKVIMVGGEIISLSIFNRWGHPVYFEENKDPQWDGTFKNAPASNGSYAYILRYKIQNSEVTNEHRGLILLER